MADDKAKDQSDRQVKSPEAQPLQSSDAKAVVLPSAQEKQLAEADRTNQSSGSIAELALKSRGMSREQVQQQLAAQGDSVSIDYGNGLEASRKTGFTAKDIELKAQGPQEDQRPITDKPVEVGPHLIKAGLDYNVDDQPLSQKLVKFVESAQARLLDPAGREAYFQGLIDKTLGIGEGLNEAKEEIKAGVGGAALKAWTGLTDGSVARFLAQPIAINEPLFKTIGNCLDVMSKNPNAVNNVLTIMGRELEAANDKYSQMTPRERGIQDGKAMFYFINPSGSMEAADMAMLAGDRVLDPVDKALVEVVRKSMETAAELSKTSVEAANQTKEMLFDWLKSKGFTPKDLQLVGVPDGYFNGVEAASTSRPSDNVYAMSKSDDLGDAGGKILSSSADQIYLERLPIFKPGGKTSGIFVSEGQEIDLLSGYDGPSKLLPLKTPGFNNIVKSHVEAHASAFMRLHGLTQGRIYINNPDICSPCIQCLPYMLEPGSKLEVVLPDGTIRFFVGRFK